MTEITRQPKEKGRRRRRFRRDPEFRPEGSRAGRLQLNTRDLDILAAVASHRFLNTEQAVRLFGCDCPLIEKDGIRNGKRARILVKAHRPGCTCTCGVEGRRKPHAPGCPALFKDRQHIGARLRELYQAGFLERPIVQLQLRVKAGVVAEGSVPMVYTITPAGLDLIGPERRAAIGGSSKLSWVGKANEGGRLFMEHQLAVGDVSIALDVALRQARLERLPEARLREGMSEARRNGPRPFALKAQYKGIELTTICDLAVALGDPIERKRWNYMIEVDMSSMPVERGDLSRTSIMRKLIGYARAYEEGLHKSELGWKSFRVLILTTSEARVRSMIEAARNRFGTATIAKLFLFGTLAEARDMTTARFSDVDGKQVGILDPR